MSETDMAFSNNDQQWQWRRQDGDIVYRVLKAYVQVALSMRTSQNLLDAQCACPELRASRVVNAMQAA